MRHHGGRGLLVVLTSVLIVWGWPHESMGCPPVKRSTALLRQFKKTHACPATGIASATASCEGYVIDHQLPLCLTGPKGDTMANLAWQEREAAKAKDRMERALCRRYRRTCPHQGD